MKVARSVAEILSEHTTLALECIDRLYLNVYVPVLQRAAGAAYFFRKMRGAAVPSSVLMAPIAFPLRIGNTSRLPSPSVRAAARTSSARPHGGTVWIMAGC